MLAGVSREPEKSDVKHRATVPIAHLTKHAVLTAAFVGLALLLSRGTRARVEVGALLLASLMIAASGLWRFSRPDARRASLQSVMPYATFIAGLLCLASGRATSSETTGIALAASGLVLCVAAIVLFIRDLRDTSR